MQDLIRRVLEQEGISQVELAEKIGVSPATLKRLKGALCGNVSDYMKEHVRTQLLEILGTPVVKRQGKTEKTPKFVEINGIFTITYGSNKEIKLSKDKLRAIKHYYCTGKFTLNQTALKFGLLREELYAIKTAFKFVKTDIPFLDEDFDNNSVDDLAEKQRIEKKRLFNEKLENKKYEDMEKRLKKYDTENFFLQKVLDSIKDIEPLDVEKDKWKVVNTGYDRQKGIIHLTDFHFGSNIKVMGNAYNKKIAKERIYRLFEESISFFKKNNIEEVYILFTGDMSNVLLHRDKQLAQMGSRAKDMVELADFLARCINYYTKTMVFNVAGVLGNESRLSDEFSGIDEWASDSYDYIMYQMLKAKLSNNKRVDFINECDTLETIIQINNCNIALLHGDTLKGNINKAVNNINIKWLSQGFNNLYVLFGHIHDTLITNSYARGGGLVGADSYSEHKLNIPISYPSQNIGIVNEDNVIMLPIKL